MRRLPRIQSFFHELLASIRPSDEDRESSSEAEHKDEEKAAEIASRAWEVLHDWAHVSGADEDGVIDGAALESWVKEARILCA